MKSLMAIFTCQYKFSASYWNIVAKSKFALLWPKLCNFGHFCKNQRDVTGTSEWGLSKTSGIIWGGLLIDSTVVSTAQHRAFVPFVLITPNHELWVKIYFIIWVLRVHAYCTRDLNRYCNMVRFRVTEWWKSWPSSVGRFATLIRYFTLCWCIKIA